MTKKIVIITQTLLSGGAEKQSVYLAKVLSKNFQVYLIVLKGNSIEKKFLDIIKDENVEIIRLSGILFKNIIDTYKLFKKENIQIIFSYLASGNFINGIVGLIARVPNRIGGIRNAELSSKKLPFERLFHNYFLTKTISNSHSAVTGLSKLKFKERKFHVIHNAFELNQSFISRTENDEVNIISMARFVPQKDYFTALEAIKILSSKMKSLKNKFVYYLIGYGEMEQAIRDKVKELDLEGVVRIIIKPNNLVDYFKRADIFLSTSLFEGMSNSVMEAMSFSLPIIATPAGDMEYLVKEGENGYLCEMRNPVQIANKLLLIIQDFELRKKMGEKSYQIISENFTMDRFRNNYVTFIKNLN